ncbi:hypothetical protein BD311DRAFT_689237 [Dichomitus squalens]|uniref:Probable RNA-binding protein 18 n=1 Tax=Dichomitus squalens TaxID=114155 RepID=A0A4Q9MUA8_9APHY|nr:hypothetical protein BD311DRAFT_689237 [Dichomitus squalens]
MSTTPQGRSPSVVSPERTPPNTASASTVLEDHLSYPAAAEPVVPVASSSSSATEARPLLKDRLYVGNLHPSVDEYTLLQAFSKFGKISKLDYLFHKSGPLKGKPRGYAFVQYSNKDDAEKALTHANDKLLRGRKLVVTYANQAPLDAASGALGAGAKNRRAISEVGKPTTLSLLKSAGRGRSDAMDAKIARMEAKLRQLEGASAAPRGTGGTSASASSSLPAHPSLPPKPIAATAALESGGPRQISATSSAMGVRQSGAKFKTRMPALPLPSLPITPPAQSLKRLSEKAPLPSPSASTNPKINLNKKSGLAGVKIVKSKPTHSAG